MFNFGNSSHKMWKEAKECWTNYKPKYICYRLFFSAFAVAITMPAPQSVFLLTQEMLPRYLSGRRSSSEPRCVASSARHKTEFLFVEHHDDHSTEGGIKQMERGSWFIQLIFPCQWWHPDPTWLRDAELWHYIGHDRNTSLSSIFRLTTYLDFKQLFCNLSLCISVQWFGKNISSTTPYLKWHHLTAVVSHLGPLQ